MRTDGQTDNKKKLIVEFRNFAKFSFKKKCNNDARLSRVIDPTQNSCLIIFFFLQFYVIGFMFQFLDVLFWHEPSITELLTQSVTTTPHYIKASSSCDNEPSAQPLSNLLRLHRTFREMGTILVQIIRNLELTGHCSTVPLPPPHREGC
jgi:hypothetical protein